MAKFGKNRKSEKDNNAKSNQNLNSIEATTLVSLLHDIGHKSDMEDVDELVQNNTQAEISDNTYQDITRDIVQITKTNLEKQEKNKEKLRIPLQRFIVVILSVQLALLAIFMFFNDSCFNLDTEVIKTYILSVFAETLLGLTIMIRFAFSNKQEVELISILNSVVSDFKVFGADNNASNDNKNEKKE